MKPVLVSISCVAVYRLGHLIPVPFTNEIGFARLDWSVPSIFALGLLPFITCFFLVELFSLTLGRRIRKSGLDGRARLNRAAVKLSIALAAIQALGIAMYLRVEPDIWNLQSKAVAVTTMTVSLLAGSVASYALGRYVSANGIGNGFSLLLAVDILASPLQPEWRPGPQYVIEPELLFRALPVILLVGLVVALFHNRSANGTVTLGVESKTPITIPLPTFPQGVVSLVWASLLLGRFLLLVDPFYEGLGYWRYAGLQVTAILLCSSLGWIVFSSRQRLQTNLAGIVHDHGTLYATLRRQFVRALLLTLATATVITALEMYMLAGWEFPILLPEVIILVLIAADLAEEWRLTARCGPTVSLIELDNVYLANYLQGLLRHEGIDVVVRGRRHRGLFFFFLPLVKMSVLVPSGARREASEILERVRPSILIV